jgi:hypothetical protein
MKRTRHDPGHCEETMTSRFEFQAQVEYDLGRPLTDVELQEVASLDELSDEQIAVVAAIRPHSSISPLVYVRAVVPAANYADVKKLIDEDIERIAIERFPPEELPNQQLFEHYAGRPLRPIERLRVESFEKIRPEQIDLARTLARAGLATCFLYLSRIVPGESIERRHELAKHLAES